LAAPLNDVAAIPFFALLIGATWQDRGLVSRLLHARVFLYLGTISYSIYLNHVPILQFVQFFWSRIVVRLSIEATIDRVGLIVATYALVLLVSHWTYRNIEVPGRVSLARMIGRTKNLRTTVEGKTGDGIAKP
jgi:peptidoglycan/LPS O-acetylase OafA/YrhL